MAAERSESSGRVVEPMPNAMFRVELATGQRVLCHVAPRARPLVVAILPGDQVAVELSPYDVTRGRITRLVK